MSKDVNEDLRHLNLNEKQKDFLTSNLSHLELEVKRNQENEEEIIESLEQVYENYKQEYLKSINLKKPDIKPIGSTVVLSSMLMNMLEHGEYVSSIGMTPENIRDFKNRLSETQYVMAIGPNVTQVEVGDLVKVRFSDFYRVVNPNSVNRKEEFHLDVEEIEDNRYVFCHEGNIKFAYGRDKKKIF